MLQEKSAAFRELHKPGAPVVLGNIWDALGARAAEEAGFPAVATTSETVARSLGYEDFEAAPADEMLAAAARIAGAVSVPVTVDVESGYGLEPAELVARLVKIGAAGLNIEDTDYRADKLADPADQARRIAGIREAAEKIGVPLVINARTDVFLRAVTTGAAESSAVDEAVARGKEYLAAGADVVYPLLASEEQIIGSLVEQLGPINVLATPVAPSIERLAELGVTRVSLGPGLGRGYEGWLKEELTGLAAKAKALG
ncbi:isocitrate lyase/phosphoenolpyruvate mutase family protein [Saccharopolyspora taberi]|uniref:Isocitrate lyase/phosphoenolpyruvate mutase family protein n=1 Tax=Saccharopolyspora taberi TaxID=60895 RepID=A0ABN3VA42_9PSEU